MTKDIAAPPDPLIALARLEGVASALASTRAGVDVLLRDRGMRRVDPDQSAEALLAGVRASVSLEADPDRWLPGAARMATELIPLAGEIRTAPGQVLARLHLLLAQGTVPDDLLGRIRTGASTDRLAGLTRLLTTKTAAPTLVLAAVAHAEVCGIGPFTLIGRGEEPGRGADGVIARAVEHLVLMAGGIDPAGVVVVERGHADAADDYRQALAGYRTGTAAGVRDWLLHCLRAVARGVEVSPLRGH